VLEEYADSIFECDKSKYSAEFMTLCYNTRTEWLETIPAVVQLLDRSSRPQIVNSENNPNFHSIISEYYKISGIPVVLNTSFNAHGEPINNYPHQVIRHLIDGVVDHIVTEDFIISRKIS
jgi:carbamoyltransferase